MLYKFRFLIYAILVLTFVFCFGLLYVSLSGKDQPMDYNTPKTELNGIFSIYEGKVYAMVPSNGYYEVKGANVQTFKTFTESFEDAHIGYDDRHVYAGNIILKGLNPKKLKVLGNNYYTDGVTTYYCARNSENNDDLGAVKFVVQLIGQSMGLADKPQNYWYPFLELPKNKTYQSRPGYAIAGSDTHTFYKGLEMSQASPATIRPLSIRYAIRNSRESTSYFTDGRHVYYENRLLSVAYNEGLFEAGIEGDMPSRSAYLIDDRQGVVFADGHSFDSSFTPYKMLSLDLKHANQALFSSSTGIYFYDTESEKMESAGDNPFPDNQFKELMPDVFSSGNKIYFLSAAEHWGRKTGLRSRSTHLKELLGVMASSFRKIGQNEERYANVWQSGNRYFYIDDLGSSNLMPSAIYEIKDAATASYLANATGLRSEDIHKLNRAGQLMLPDSKAVATAKVSYSNDWYQSYWLIFGAVAVVFFFSLLMRNKKIAPFLLKDGYLIVNNLSFKKYRIADIEKVVFKAVKTNYKSNGYSGRMQVYLKNGKTSRNSLFSARMTLTSESESTIKAYIQELRSRLEQEGVKSELVQ